MMPRLGVCWRWYWPALAWGRGWRLPPSAAGVYLGGLSFCAASPVGAFGAHGRTAGSRPSGDQPHVAVHRADAIYAGDFYHRRDWSACGVWGLFAGHRYATRRIGQRVAPPVGTCRGGAAAADLFHIFRPEHPVKRGEQYGDVVGRRRGTLWVGAG